MAARCHRLAVEHGRDAVAAERVVLVEGDDEEAVVGLGPGGVGAQVVLQPGVAGGHRAVVHVAAQVRDDEGDLRQRRVVGRELREGVRRGGGDVAEAEPGVVLAGVVPAAAGRRALAGQRLVVAGPGLARGDQLRGQVVGAAEAGGVAAVVGDPLGGAGEQGEVVGLAGVGDRVRLRQVGAAGRERVDVRGAGGADDLVVRVVLEDHDDHVVGVGTPPAACAVECGRARPTGRRRQRRGRGRKRARYGCGRRCQKWILPDTGTSGGEAG